MATTLKNVDLFPYTISIDKIGTSIEDKVFTLKFNYELTKEKLTEINTEGHNLLLVFEDGGGIKRFEKSLISKTLTSSMENPRWMRIRRYDLGQERISKSRSRMKALFLILNSYKNIHLVYTTNSRAKKIGCFSESGLVYYNRLNIHQRVVSNGLIKPMSGPFCVQS